MNSAYAIADTSMILSPGLIFYKDLIRRNIAQAIAVAGGAWWSFLEPLVMSILLMRVSGVALLEKDIGDGLGAHLGLEVVGRHPGRRNQQPVFAREGRLAAAVQKIGHVGVLLGLGGVELAPARL